MSFIGRVLPQEGLRLRSGPGTQHSILGVLEKDELVDLFELTGEWWRVQSRMGPGFVHSAFVAAVPDEPEEPEESYTCVAGDTLFGIGRRFGLNHLEIAMLNGLVEPFALQVGQVLRIRRSGGGVQPVVATISILNPFLVAGETEVTSSSLQGHHRPWLGDCSCDLDVRGVSSPGVGVHFNVVAPPGLELRGRVESVGLACRSQRLSDGGRTVKVVIEKRARSGEWLDCAWVLYAHLDPVDVVPGALIFPGARIGAMGPANGAEYFSSCAQGSHVHMEASRARCVVNQQSVITNAPVIVLDS